MITIYLPPPQQVDIILLSTFMLNEHIPMSQDVCSLESLPLEAFSGATYGEYRAIAVYLTRPC